MEVNRIYIEITRNNGELDFFRFENERMLTRAFMFLEDQLTQGNVKAWVMKNIPTLAVDKYDVIED